MIKQTGERVIPGEVHSEEEYLMYLRHVIAYEFALTKLSSEDNLLEVGCGEGYGTKMISSNVKKIVGLDVDSDLIVYATEKYSSENCIYQYYDGKKIPFDNNTFDAAISFQVIEHIEDDRNYVSEVNRVLKPSGIFILTTPNRLTRLKDGQKPYNKFHIREYSPQQLEHLLTIGFNKVMVLGIQARKEIREREFRRIAKIQRKISLDPLNIRALIPEEVKNMIGQMLSKKDDKAKEVDFHKYSTEDYFIVKENIEDCLDLLCICEFASTN
jgi:ubiquinone/menaquinone biosynthesis C-methylase UbiE